MNKQKEMKEPCRATEYTRPIFVGKERSLCKKMDTPVASDKCWSCQYNMRKRYDPTKPKETVECLMWNGYRFEEI